MKKEPKIVRTILGPTIVVVWVHVIGVMVELISSATPQHFKLCFSVEHTTEECEECKPLYHTNKSRNSVIANSYLMSLMTFVANEKTQSLAYLLGVDSAMCAWSAIVSTKSLLPISEAILTIPCSSRHTTNPRCTTQSTQLLIRL